jgi:DNA-directed RNA polymerase subunit omega
MSRFLMEECLKRIPDHFLLVVLAAYRARVLASGGVSPLLGEGHKEAVMALQEIARGYCLEENLQEGMIKSLQNFSVLSENSKNI